MPSPTTAIDLITRSMRLAKILADGETPTASEAVDALATLNDVLENWDTEPLSVWGAANETFATVAGQAVYTIGPGGNFNTDRPERVDGAYVNFNGVDFDLEIVDQLKYNTISLKTQQQPIPQWLLYVTDFPLGLITLWPVPSQVVPITITAGRILSQIPTLATAINYPPGGAKALRYALAVELAVEYGVPPDPVLASLAADAKGDYKRANFTPVRSTYDAALVGVYGTGDWRTGG